jgi:hypothetical protein
MVSLYIAMFSCDVDCALIILQLNSPIHMVSFGSAITFPQNPKSCIRTITSPLNLPKKRNLLANRMSNINIEKGIKVNADIKLGCVDVAKVAESRREISHQMTDCSRKHQFPSDLRNK